MTAGDPPTAKSRLPRHVQRLFWDHDPAALDLRRHRGYIIRRILDRGDEKSFAWLRETVGDQAIRDWLLQKKGGGLEPEKLRFWELVLHLPADVVDEWVRQARKSVWHGRTKR